MGINNDQRIYERGLLGFLSDHGYLPDEYIITLYQSSLGVIYV